MHAFLLFFEPLRTSLGINKLSPLTRIRLQAFVLVLIVLDVLGIAASIVEKML
jgi:hypothetical protein